MARTKRLTSKEMGQAEALDVIRAATSQNYILVSDAAQASGVSELTIRKQIDEDNKNGTNLLGFQGEHWGGRYLVHRASFIKRIERGV